MVNKCLHSKSNKKVPSKEEQIKDMENWQDGIAKNCTDLSIPFKGETFEELQNSIIKRGGSEAEKIICMRNQHEDIMKELCDLCGKSHEEHDSRGFIYFHGNIEAKAGWSCVEKLIIQYKKVGLNVKS